MESLKKFQLQEGLNFYYYPTEKFKTFTVNFFIHRPLTKETATKNALLPYVLRRGTNNYPNAQIIAKYMEELYGTIFDFGIQKKGEDQIIYFKFETIADSYVPEKETLLEKILTFVQDLIFNPVTENNAFKKEYVDQEKLKLKDLIHSLINNKMYYAVERCYQEMCKDEAFGIYELGNVDDLEYIDEKNLYEYYKEVISSSPMDIFITGDMDEKQVYELVKQKITIDKTKAAIYPSSSIIKEVPEKPKKVIEELDVSQGKLSLGFRTKISPTDKEYYALMIYNGILGGGPHSKLFNNVREKLSLAYYVFSRLERFKGLMIISSGIEIDNYEKAYNEILLQMEEIKKGNITDYEYEATMNSMINGIRSLQDNAFHIVDYYLSQIIGESYDDFENLIKNLSSVQKEDVVSVAQDIQLDTIYFLRSFVNK